MLILFFAIFHCFYGTWLKTNKVSHFNIWFIFTLIDVCFYFFSNIKSAFYIAYIVVFTLILLVNIYFIIKGNDYHGENVDIYLILGHQLVNNQMTICLQNRLDKCIELVKDNNKDIILSGGKNNSSISEAKLMREYLIYNGIDERRILLEEESTTTLENMEFTLSRYPFIKKLKVLIISSDYHLMRAKHIAKSFHIENVKGLSSTSEKGLLLHRLILEIYLIIFKK